MYKVRHVRAATVGWKHAASPAHAFGEARRSPNGRLPASSQRTERCRPQSRKWGPTDCTHGEHASRGLAKRQRLSAEPSFAPLASNERSALTDAGEWITWLLPFNPLSRRNCDFYHVAFARFRTPCLFLALCPIPAILQSCTRDGEAMPSRFDPFAPAAHSLWSACVAKLAAA